MSDPRRVLVVTHEASRTGAPRVALDLLDALSAGGWRSTAVLRWGGPLEADFARSADAVVHEPARHLRAALSRWGWAKRTLVPPLERWSAARVIRRSGADLVWCNTVISSPYAVAASRLRVPSVLLSHEHEGTVERTTRRSGLARDVARPGPDRPVLLGCAPRTAEVLAEGLGLSADEVGVLHSPVDVQAVRAAGAAPSTLAPTGGVLAVGLANRTKGADVFAEAARLAQERGMTTPWRWVGEAAMDLPQTPAQFVGARSNAAAEIAAADVLVLPSRADAFPLVVLEAMALGTPVVAVDLPGPREQLGGTGVLVPQEDPAAIVDAVAAVLADPDAAAARAAEASQRCEQRWDVGTFRERVRSISAAAVEQRPVRVVHLLTRLSRGAGIQVVVRRLIDELDTEAVETQVVTVKGEMERDRLDELGAEVHALGHPTNGQSPLDRARIVIDMARTVRRLRPDVVQVHSGTSWIGIGARVWSPRSSFLLEVHDAPGSGRHGRRTDWLEGRWPRWAGAHVVCHSTSVSREVEQRWHVPPDRITMIPLAVDVDRFAPIDAETRRRWRAEHDLASDAPAMVAVGRFAPSKRFDDAIRVLASVQAEHSDARLVLIGDGVERPNLEGLVAELGCAGSVHFTGPLYDDQLATAIAACDVLLSTSEYEGFGLTIIEAMACATPVVATAVGGVTDLVVDGVTGHLVPPGDVVTMAARVRGLSDASLARRMGDAARRRAVQDFSFEPFGRRFAELYVALGSGGAPGSGSG